MGTHTYLLEVFRKDKDKPLPTPNSIGFHKYSSCSAGDIDDILEDFSEEQENRYMEEFTCRELLLNDSYIWYPVFHEPENNYMVGIRCYGELYSIVSEFLQCNKESKSLVKKVLEDVFGITVEIKYGALSQLLARRVFGNYIMEYGDGYKKVLGYVSLYIPSLENTDIPALDCGVSAILALLKEPRIISGILQGKINDKQDVCKELIKISRDRHEKIDDSYNCLALTRISSLTARTMTELKSSIREQLFYRNNDDGSDWYSIANLAVFCYGFRSYFTGYDVSTNEGGPSAFVIEKGHRALYEGFKGFVQEDDILKYLSVPILDLSEGNENDFDEDSSLWDYNKERMIKSWANE